MALDGAVERSTLQLESMDYVRGYAPPVLTFPPSEGGAHALRASMTRARFTIADVPARVRPGAVAVPGWRSA